jgi:hypothetical protein
MATASPLIPTCNIVTPIGMLGYGLNESLTASLLAAVIPNGAPTAISKPLIFSIPFPVNTTDTTQFSTRAALTAGPKSLRWAK